ncbi:MAG: C45 family peptidase [Chloroflexota bacterium]
MSHKKIRVQKITGAAYDRGFQHGSAHRDAIRHYTEERITLVQGGQWTGKKKVSRQEVLSIAEAMLPHHQSYAADIYEEMRGMADGCGLSLAEMVVVGGFTDFIDTVYNNYKMSKPLSPELAIDDRTAFIVPNERAGGSGFFGQTWDMHDTATEFVILLDVDPAEGEGPGSLVFTTTGCVGQIGMNEHGVAIGINNLLGADGQIGVTWPFVVRKALQQDNVEDALACITDATQAGAHNNLIFDKSGKGYNVEAMATRY